MLFLWDLLESGTKIKQPEAVPFLTSRCLCQVTVVVDFTVVMFDEQFDANDLVQFSDKLKESLDAAGKRLHLDCFFVDCGLLPLAMH